MPIENAHHPRSFATRLVDVVQVPYISDDRLIVRISKINVNEKTIPHKAKNEVYKQELWNINTPRVCEKPKNASKE